MSSYRFGQTLGGLIFALGCFPLLIPVGALAHAVWFFLELGWRLTPV